MAEGLLTQPGVNVDIEQVGEECFDDLVSRSFFQQSRGSERFLMHELFNVLAKSISREFCFRYGFDRSCQISKRIRHLYLGHAQVDEEDKGIFTIQRLRTILVMDWHQQQEVENRLLTFTRLRVLFLSCLKLPDSIGNLMHLRYLNLSFSSIQRLPDSLATLCNLETLLLRGCNRLVELPATIFKLINLSQLDIRGTKLGKMPPHMGKLKKLGELDYYIVGKESDCSIKELGPLQRLRRSLCIKKLRNVSQVKESEEANLKCKEKLKRLELIWNDEGNEDSLHERNVLEQLQPHTNIEKLAISGYAGMRFPDWVGDSSFSNMVELELEGCRYCQFLPPLGQLGSLKRLSIVGFDGIDVVGPDFYGNSNKPPFRCLESLKFKGMPQWQEWVLYSTMDKGDGATAAFPLLQVLKIRDCPKLSKTLPADLLSLKSLKIRDCSSLESFSLDLAPALEKLDIVDCGNLKFISAAATAEFKHLKSLKIRDCPNLKEILPTHLPSLIKLRIRRFDQLVSLPRAPALQKLEILASADLPRTHEVRYRNSSHSPLEMVEQLMAPNSIPFELRRLVVGGWDSVTSFPLDLFPMLESLEIYDFPKLESLSAASQAQPLQRCKFLKLRECPNLRRLQECMVASLFPSLEYLEIRDCPESIVVDLLRISPNLSRLRLRSCREEVKSFPPENMLMPSTLTFLEIEDFPNLTSFNNKALQSLTCLKDLTLRNCPKLQSLAELSTLTTLEISRLENLESLDHGGLHRLTSLTTLGIFDCPKLQSISHEGPPSSLEVVRTHKCPLLKLDNDWHWEQR